MLILRDIKELATCGPRGIIRNANVVIDKGKIFDINDSEKFAPYLPSGKDVEIIDAQGLIALPGFVDCHTHTVFAGSRAKEYEAKLRGESYTDVHQKGHGIHSTVQVTRGSSMSELRSSTTRILHEMFLSGTTTVEIKSGYGLTLSDEQKILAAVKAVGKDVPQDVVATFLGAHTIPKEFSDNRAGYIDLVINEMLPRVVSEAFAQGVDIFCDPLGFTVPESEKILSAAKQYGFPLHVHGEQTAHFGGAKLAAKFRALSLDHGDYLDDEDILALKEAGTTVVLLPGVILHCMEWNKIDYPLLAKELKTAGVPIAFATDYNPGSSPIHSMKLIMDLGMRFFKMSSEECLPAATLNSARALGMENHIGSIDIGKQADLLLVRAHSVADYLYQIGDRPFDYLIKKGKLIF